MNAAAIELKSLQQTILAACQQQPVVGLADLRRYLHDPGEFDAVILALADARRIIVFADCDPLSYVAVGGVKDGDKVYSCCARMS